MREVPVRLVVISARVPEGPRCDGCDFDLVEYGQCQLWPELVRESAGPYGDGLRLPACRARDGWVAIPPAPARDVGDDYRLAAFLTKQRGWACFAPGSGVPELVEAAKARQAAESAVVKAHYRGTGSMQCEWDLLKSREEALAEAVRKVAGEGER